MAVEVVLPLLLVHLRFYLLVDIRLYLAEFQLHVQHGEQLHRAHLDVVVLKEVHLVREVVHLDGGGDEVDQELEVVDVPYGGDGLARSHRGIADDVPCLLLEGVGDGLYGCEVTFRKVVVQIMDPAGEIGVVVDDGIEREALESLQDGGYRAVRHLQALDNPGHGTILI